MCLLNNIGNNLDNSNVKEAEIIQRSVENITISKQTYQHFYNLLSQYFATTIKFLPPHELEEIDRDLQRHFHFIDFKSKFNNDEILYTFCEFFLKKWSLSRFLKINYDSKTKNI